MAQIIPKAKKDGSMSYLVRVYAGRTQDDKVITKCKTVTPPAGMGKKKAEKWVQEQAVLFDELRQSSLHTVQELPEWAAKNGLHLLPLDPPMRASHKPHRKGQER